MRATTSQRGSPTVRAGTSTRSGSSQRSWACRKSMPCLARFVALFPGSNSNSTNSWYRNYTLSLQPLAELPYRSAPSASACRRSGCRARLSGTHRPRQGCLSRRVPTSMLEPLGDPDLDDRLTGHAEALGFPVELLDHPGGEVHVDPPLLQTGSPRS